MLAKHKQTIILAILTIFLPFVSTQVVYASIIPTPTHFNDTQWGLMDPAGYNSLEVDIKVEVEESPLVDGYYFANTVYFRNYTGNNFGGAYAGFQTNGYDGTKWIGKMAIFSVWDVTNGIAEPGGVGTPFTGEGTGYSIRLPYNWVAGTSYRLKIYIDQDAASGDRLWGASLTNLTTGLTTRIGRIYVPVSRGKIYGPVTFHEIYLSSDAACSDVKKSQVSFTNATGNGSIKATGWNHYNVANIQNCPNINWLNDGSDGYQSGVATPKPAPAPAATPKPVTKAPDPVVQQPSTQPQQPVATTTQPTPTQEPATDKIQTATKDASTTTPETNNPHTFAIVAASLSLIGLGVLGYLLTRSVQKRRYLKLIAKHFPYDPDLR